MTRTAAAVLSAVAMIASPLQAQDGEDALERGFAGALRGCELWVLEPASWAEGSKSYLDRVGLGPMMAMAESVPDVARPPEMLRAGNVYWRINSRPDAGYILVVSSQLAMCHITAGGEADLQPVIERVLASPDFLSRWTLVDDQSLDDMISTVYRNKSEARFSLQISRAPAPGGRQDRVQLLATAVLDLDRADEVEGSGSGQ